MGLKIRLPLDLQKIAATPIVTPWRMALHWENPAFTTHGLTPRPQNRPLKIAKLTPCKKPEVAGSAGHCEPGVGRFTDPHPFTCSFFTPSLHCLMFGLCSLSSARSKSVLLVEENFVFYCGHSVLRYVPFAGPAGPTFSFLPFPSFSQRFLSEWKQCWFSPAWGSPLPLSLPTNGSHASNRADNLFRWCVPLPSSQNRTQALTVAYLFSPCSLLTFPLRGKAVLFSKLGCPGFLDSSTTASHGPNGAGLRPLWRRSPTQPPKPHTGPHRPAFGSHRRFLVRFGSGKAAKSRSSL